ncbi:type II toxin-antitoxin system HicB family antitoxin [Candidatus Palauibacter scopulicola]|uniref:type II toxin-antitoxin system HicB family antitoxin n=1 Tax=Candidatus Palauibacter scopulicola TaxID=3056741 RepID=UPI00287376C2|nr:type II toxin-antitoxin system HicB family antitoxin [Candidatus Palauibacter scopulicola]
MRFPIVVHKDADSGYGVTVPDLPGCFSAGDTLDEVIESAREAIACHIEGLLMDGEPIPARTSLEAHQGNDDYRGGVWAIADVDISKLSSRTKRINITLPERVLAIVDRAAVREGQSRSGLLARAALSYLEHQSEGDFRGLLTDRPDSSDAYGTGSAQQSKRRSGDGE